MKQSIFYYQDLISCTPRITVFRHLPIDSTKWPWSTIQEKQLMLLNKATQKTCDHRKPHTIKTSRFVKTAFNPILARLGLNQTKQAPAYLPKPFVGCPPPGWPYRQVQGHQFCHRTILSLRRHFLSSCATITRSGLYVSHVDICWLCSFIAKTYFVSQSIQASHINLADAMDT